jgi:hypothetical protein
MPDPDGVRRPEPVEFGVDPLVRLFVNLRDDVERVDREMPDRWVTC